MSDRVAIAGPLNPATIRILEQDALAGGVGPGLGCAANGKGGVAACSGRDSGITAYDAEGNRRFSASMGSYAFASAPIVAEDGSVIAADELRVVRFDPVGNVVWETPTPGGIPISPIVVQSKYVVLAALGGPISAYRLSDGARVATLRLTDGTTLYDTRNTPCALGSRFFVSTSLRSDRTRGRLYAINLVEQASQVSLAPSWFFDFGGPGGASPDCVRTTDTAGQPAHLIYFDGAHLTSGSGTGDPYLVGLRDRGSAFEVLWAKAVPSPIGASGAQDPRGGIWYFPNKAGFVIRLDYWDGRVLQRLNLHTVIGNGGAYKASSALSISPGTQGQPTMVLGIIRENTDGSESPSVAAIRLAPGEESLVWSVSLPDSTAAQFPVVVNAAGKPRIIFPTHSLGPFFIGSP